MCGKSQDKKCRISIVIHACVSFLGVTEQNEFTKCVDRAKSHDANFTSSTQRLFHILENPLPRLRHQEVSVSTNWYTQRLEDYSPSQRGMKITFNLDLRPCSPLSEPEEINDKICSRFRLPRSLTQ